MPIRVAIASALAVALMVPPAAAAPPADNPGRGPGASQNSPGTSSAPTSPGRPDSPGNSSSTPADPAGSPGQSSPGNSSGQGQGASANVPSNPAANPATNGQPSPAANSGNGANQSESRGPTSTPAADRARIPTAALQSPGQSALRRALNGKISEDNEAEQASALALRSCLTDAADKQSRNNARREAKGKPVTDDANDWAPGQIKKLQAECEEEVGDRGDYIIVFTPGAAAADRAQEVRKESARRDQNRIEVKKVYDAVFPGALIGASEKQAEALRKNPNVQIIEPDGLAQAIAVQDPAPWGLDRTDQRSLPLNGSYNYERTGSGVTAYIVDTGVRADHVDFSGRVTSGFTAIADGNGTGDCNGHGTHVAGTVAGTSYGVAKGASVVPVRVLDCYGSGTWSGVIEGLNFVAAQHATGTPAVANMSLGGGASSSVDLAVRNLVADGVSVVVAAGNSSSDACNASPAREPSAITVAASDSGDTQAYFSNYGSCVDIYAPGVGVTSAWYTSPTSSASLSGTSMASPHVAGASALVLEGAPASSPQSVWSTLRDDATTGVLNGIGSGSPDALLFIPAGSTEDPDEQDPVDEDPIATVPEAPTGVSAEPGIRSAVITWVLPPDGGSSITSQYIYVYDDRGKVRGTIQVAGDVTTVEIDRLRPNKPYTFRVSAINVIGQGDLSAPSSPVSARNR